MKLRTHTTVPSLLWAALTAQACASSGLPTSMPASSPASAQAAEAPRDRVTTALSSEPPLPGEPLQGWPGLERRAASAAPDASHEQDHAHHGGHGQAPDDGAQSPSTDGPVDGAQP